MLMWTKFYISLFIQFFVKITLIILIFYPCKNCIYIVSFFIHSFWWKWYVFLLFLFIVSLSKWHAIFISFIYSFLWTWHIIHNFSFIVSNENDALFIYFRHSFFVKTTCYLSVFILSFQVKITCYLRQPVRWLQICNRRQKSNLSRKWLVIVQASAFSASFWTADIIVFMRYTLLMPQHI